LVTTLTATADSGSTFIGWSGGGCTGTGTCPVVLTADTVITALFNPALPVAEFSGAPTVAVQSVTVTFTDLSTENPTSWSWDFGDGTTSTLKNPTHNYNVVGTYNVKLTAINASGSNTVVKTGYVVVQPYIRIVGSPTGYRNIQEAYDAAPDGAIIQVRDLNLVENLNANSAIPKTIALQGGYNADYSIGTGVTNMKGSITSSKGSMTIKNFVLQQ
jgi:PKD repeat protein